MPLGGPLPETTAAANDGEMVPLEDVTGYVVRRKELEMEEGGSCCCYGRRNIPLDVVKQKARVTISDLRTGEKLVEKVFEPPKVCPKIRDLEGIEPSYLRIVPAEVVEAWAKRVVSELESKRRPEVRDRSSAR